MMNLLKDSWIDNANRLNDNYIDKDESAKG